MFPAHPDTSIISLFASEARTTRLKPIDRFSQSLRCQNAPGCRIDAKLPIGLVGQSTLR